MNISVNANNYLYILTISTDEKTFTFQKFYFTITAILAFAQNNENDHPITFGIVGGSDFAFLQVSSAHRDEVYTNSENPFSLGFNADFKMSDYFSIRPGIFYAGKGGTLNAVYDDNLGNNTSVNDDYKLHYLEVPVDFIGHLPFASGANLFLGAGPYFAYGLSGSNNQTIFDATTYQKIKFSGNGDGFKSTDFGATTVIGFQAAKGWSISGNLDFGLTSIIQNNTTAFDATKLKTITFYLSVGQSF